MLSVFVILILAAVILVVANAMNKLTLWPAVFVLCVIELLRTLPLGR